MIVYGPGYSLATFLKSQIELSIFSLKTICTASYTTLLENPTIYLWQKKSESRRRQSLTRELRLEKNDFHGKCTYATNNKVHHFWMMTMYKLTFISYIGINWLPHVVAHNIVVLVFAWPAQSNVHFGKKQTHHLDEGADVQQ